MIPEYRRHTLEWTDEKVSRFWSFRNTYRPFDETWFTKQAGAAVVNLVRSAVPLKGRLLDYGTGKGFLLDHLLQQAPEADIFACDFTESLAREVGERFSAEPRFRGCLHVTELPMSYPEAHFDLVFLIETIEHLTDTYLHATLEEIRRLLKPGGVVVITTPNEEPLEQHVVHCADCGATFHHMQHIRSWSAPTLQNLMNEKGFITRFCRGVNIQQYGPNGSWHRILDRLRGLRGQTRAHNLVYVGTRAAAR